MPTTTIVMPIPRTARRRSRASQTAIANAASVRSGRNQASVLRSWKPFCAASSSSERRIDDPPGVRWELVRDLLADADAVGGLEHDRSQVERDDAALGRDAVSAALEHLDERLVGSARAALEQPLEPGLLERPVDDLVRRLRGGPRWPAPDERTGSRSGSCVFELGLDVDVLEQLVDGTRWRRLSDRGVVEQLRCSCP